MLDMIVHKSGYSKVAMIMALIVPYLNILLEARFFRRRRKVLRQQLALFVEVIGSALSRNSAQSNAHYYTQSTIASPEGA